MNAWIIANGQDELLLWTISRGKGACIQALVDLKKQTWQELQWEGGYRVVEVVIKRIVGDD